MSEETKALFREVLKRLPHLTLRRFVARKPTWRPTDPLDASVEAWRALYKSIEAARNTGTVGVLMALAIRITESGVLAKDDRGKLLHAGALNFQVTACHAVAETLIRAIRTPADLDLAGDLLSICPPSGWLLPYIDLVTELSVEDGHVGLAADLAAQAYEAAESEQEIPETLRALRTVRDATSFARIPPPGSESGEAAPAPETLPDLLTAQHIADALGVTLIHARRLMTDGTVPSRKFGRQRYARKTDFLELFEPDHPGRRRHE